jgi:chromosome segregation ATPase
MSEEPTQSLPEGNIAQLVTEVRAVNERLRLLEDKVNERLQRLEDKVDARSRETQPMSERIDQILAEVAATRYELREVNHTLRRMNVDIATALRNQDDMEDHLATLENRPGQS